MSIANEAPTVTAEELTREESRQLFDEACQRLLGVRRDEFLERHETGDYLPEWNSQAIAEVEFLLPFAD